METKNYDKEERFDPATVEALKLHYAEILQRCIRDRVKAVPKFARSENFSYLAVGYLKCCIFVQLTENKPLPFRYLLSLSLIHI